jgi:hypothetical protein
MSSLSAQEVAQLEVLLSKARAAGVEPKPHNRKVMSDADFEKHVEASQAEHDRNASYNGDPRAAHFALEERVAALEEAVASKSGAKKAKAS